MGNTIEIDYEPPNISQLNKNANIWKNNYVEKLKSGRLFYNFNNLECSKFKCMMRIWDENNRDPYIENESDYLYCYSDNKKFISWKIKLNKKYKLKYTDMDNETISDLNNCFKEFS